MKEVLMALATYKTKVDEELLAIVEKMEAEKLERPLGTYFPTVLAQLKHIFGSDVNWIKRLGAAFPASGAFAGSRFASFDLESLKVIGAKEAGRLFADMRELDELALSFVRSLDEEALRVPVTYRNYRGQEETHELWKALLQWFNHGVHHRGTISGQLDILGVENDFSSLLAKID
jgi:Uncharacterized protein conserved in bacteria